MVAPDLSNPLRPDHIQVCQDFAIEHGVHGMSHYLGVRGRIEMLAPCRVLVIGGGYDVPLYCIANQKMDVKMLGVGGGTEETLMRGPVVVFEESEEWRGKINEACSALEDHLRPTVVGVNFKTMELGEAARGLLLDKVKWDIIVVDPPRDENYDAHKAAFKWAFDPIRRDKHTWIVYSGHETEAIRSIAQGLNGTMTTAVWKSLHSRNKLSVNNTVWGVYAGSFQRRPQAEPQKTS